MNQNEEATLMKKQDHPRTKDNAGPGANLLVSLGERRVSLFKSATSKTPYKTATLAETFDVIESQPLPLQTVVRALHEEWQEVVKLHGKKSPKAKALYKKKQKLKEASRLGAFSMSVSFNGTRSNENAAKPTGALQIDVDHLTPEEWKVVFRKLQTRAKASDEMLSDHDRVGPFINGRLLAGVELKLDTQLVSGTGIAPNLTGVLNFAGIQTQAKGADTVPDAIMKAITKVRNPGFFEPDCIVIHPTDWQNLRLLKDTAGQYLGGGPFLGTYGQGGFVADVPLWGKPVVVTTAVTVGTALVGSFLIGGELFYRTGLLLSMTNSDQDDFIKNLITIRAEIRAALAVPHPTAFCQVTGL